MARLDAVRGTAHQHEPHFVEQIAAYRLARAALELGATGCDPSHRVGYSTRQFAIVAT